MCLKRCRQTRCKNHNYQIASNCTNFIGAKSETQRSLSEIFEDKISHILQNGGSDQITWKKSPTFRKLKQHGTSSNDESLITLLSGVESIVNLGRLTVETLSVIVIFKMKLHSVQSILSS